MTRILLLPAAIAFLIAGCEPGLSPPFEVEGRGTVEGLVFHDASRTGAYDPSGGDRPLAGIPVVVRERGTTQQVAAGTTDAQGRFTIENVPPGTHDLWINPAAVPGDIVFCINPRAVTVNIAQPRFLELVALDACLIPIAEARLMPAGEIVNVRGVVTSFPGQIQPSYVFIQDGSAGVQLFTGALNGLGIEIGDRVDITGSIGFFGTTNLQIDNVQLNLVEPGIGAPSPQATTTGAIEATGAQPQGTMQGRLVRVSGAKLETGFTTGGNRNALINDGSGALIVRVAAGVSAGTGDAILSGLGLTVGHCYDIVGAVGSFASDAQLFPRSAADFTEVPCP
jgi:hypothetical protein